MPPYQPALPELSRPTGEGSIPPASQTKERFEIVRLFNELRNTPPIGAVGLREFRDLLADLFPEFASVRDADLDAFLDEYVQETMAPRTPEQDWERRENSSRDGGENRF